MNNVEARGAAELDALRIAISLATAENRRSGTGVADQLFRPKTTQCLRDAFFKIVAACRANLLFECGAHEASASTTFCETPGRRAIAIEANPVTFEAKTRLAERSGVTTINCGLGAESGEACFYVPKGFSTPADASFLKKPGGDYHPVMVRIETLDAISQEYVGPDDIIALWVDVEGLALAFAKGGESTLRDPRCRLLMIEVENQQFWSEQPVASEVNAFLSSCGLVPILRDMESPGQFNLIYVKADQVGALEDLIIEYWQKLSKIKLSRHEMAIRKSRNLAGRFKEGLDPSEHPYLWKFAHRVAAALGSVSSAEKLSRKTSESSRT